MILSTCLRRKVLNGLMLFIDELMMIIFKGGGTEKLKVEVHVREVST